MDDHEGITLTDPDQILASLARLSASDAQVIQEDRATRTDLHLRFAWRLVRHAARVQGYLQADEPLSTLLDVEDPSAVHGDQFDPRPLFFGRPPRGPRRVRYESTVEMLDELDSGRPLPAVPLEIRTDREALLALTRMPLLPPAHEDLDLAPPPPPTIPADDPARRATMLEALQDHFDESDAPLTTTPAVRERVPIRDRWWTVMTRLATRIASDLTQSIMPPEVLEDSAPAHLRADRQGPLDAYREMLDSRNEDLWPDRDELIEYEECLVRETMRQTLRRGRQETREWLRRCLGFSSREARGLEGISRGLARDVTAGDVQDKRAMVEMMLEDIARRARGSLDLRAELGAVKALAVAMGVSKGEVDDLDQDFARVVRTVSNERKSLASPTHRR